MIAAAAWCAALLQVCAYVLYLRGALRRRIEPNPLSWLMWAYGTAMVVVLEGALGIDPLLQLLPGACAACSIVTAVVAWRRVRGWSWDGGDRAAFGADVALTLLYVAVNVALLRGSLSPARAELANTLLLAALCVGTVTSYLPILRSTRRDPSAEDPLPSTVWTTAYTLLLLATVGAEGMSLGALRFWAYPVVCVAVTGLVAWYARGARRATRNRPGSCPEDSLSVVSQQRHTGLARS